MQILIKSMDRLTISSKLYRNDLSNIFFYGSVLFCLVITVLRLTLQGNDRMMPHPSKPLNFGGLSMSLISDDLTLF